MSVMNESPAKAKLSLCAAVAVLGVALSGIASADTIQIVGLKSVSTESLGGYLGTLDYTPGDGVGTLAVTLENISPAANGGFITGFLFNIASADVNVSAVLQSATHPFQPASGNGAPFGGDYMSGAALGGSFLGGGNPNSGIAHGTSGTFTFLVTAEDADQLTAASFMEGPYEYDFIVRFRGFQNGGSDKVPAVQSCPCDFDHNGVTDAGDMGIFLAGWGPNPGSPLDTNGDGLVDGADFGIFLECWRDCSLQG